MSGNEGAKQHILVVGLRATGDAVIRAAVRSGDTVTVVEDDPGRGTYASSVELARRAGATIVERPTLDDWSDLVGGADLMVPSPGVRPTHPAFVAARAAGIPIRGDIDLGMEAARVPVVAVTGTNGKSTVTMLITDILVASGVRALPAGNIGRPLLDVVEEPSDVIVVEVSSFQLHTTTAAFRPHVAVLLNVAEDHLDWHGSFAEYSADKARVFAHQGEDDVLVANLDDPIVDTLAASARATVTGVTLGRDATSPSGSYTVAHGFLVTPSGREIVEIAKLPSRLPHDLTNALAATAAANAVGGGLAAARETLVNFERLHHRVEPVGKASGVEYFDDSKATNPHATLSALGGLERVVLLAGGDSKGVDLGSLAEAKERLVGVVAIGDTPDEVERALGDLVPTVRADSMRAAVAAAARLARPGDTVLLSPACASFDWYGSYQQRGDDFQQEVRRLIAEEEARA
ncbi:MAG: UDP-N-acetylmuramoyl-L-alanine--D-glutamate ligase [Acidimicrobiia bacterium]